MLRRGARLFSLLLLVWHATAFSSGMRGVPTAGRARRATLAASGTQGTLSGLRFTISLDVGQESGSWMPPKWGLSGKRALASVDVELADDGRILLQGTGAFDHLTVTWDAQEDGSIGRWVVSGDRATLWLAHTGLERFDVMLDPGRIYATAGAWGSQLGRRGNLTIRQRCMQSTTSDLSLAATALSLLSTPAFALLPGKWGGYRFCPPRPRRAFLSALSLQKSGADAQTTGDTCTK